MTIIRGATEATYLAGKLNWLRAAVLGANYPGTQWYERAYKLVGEYPPLAPPANQAPLKSTPAPTKS